MKIWTHRWHLTMSLALLYSAGGLLPSHADEAQTKPSKQALSVRSTEEVAHISSLLKALQSYAAIYEGNYPANVEGLVQKNVLSADELKKLTTSPLAIGPDTGVNGYLYYFAGKRLDTPGTAVLILGKYTLSRTDLRRAAGLQDGSVSWWKRQQVEAFLKKTSP